MSTYSSGAELFSWGRDIAEDICENETVVKVVNKTIPAAVGGVVEYYTGSKLAGTAAKAATSAFAEQHGKSVAVEATSIVAGLAVTTATCAASCLFAVALVPAGAGYLLFKGVKSLFKD